MRNSGFKEIKGINNFDFYPEHYMNSALMEDAKASGFNGRKIKELKTEVEGLLGECLDEKSVVARTELSKKWFKVLGFYEIRGTSSFAAKFEKGNKCYTAVIEKTLELVGDGSLYIVNLFGDESAENDQKVLSREAILEETIPVTNDKNEIDHVKLKEFLSGLFDSDYCSAEWIIVNSGVSLYLFERGKWQEGTESYLEADMIELFGVNSDESFAIFESLFSHKSFSLSSAESFHEKIEQNSHKKAAEVTKALRDTVRESIEIIANEILLCHANEPLESLRDFDLSAKEGRDKAAAEVFDQSLRYIYRMLFMFFAESQNEKKGALPVQSRVYQLGYAIEKLRELENVQLVGDVGTGNFIQQSLENTFRIYFGGYNTQKVYVDGEKKGEKLLVTDAHGFSFPALGTNLFDPDSTPLFQEAVLEDRPMQEVIRKLSLAQVGAGKKKRTYRVHYAGLGLNQLGAVYEGLLSLKPEILGEDAVLLAKDKKEAAHRFAPKNMARSLNNKVLAYDEDGELITKEKGEFLLAPVGLERKFSASFYTPEVLTRFLAKEAVSSLLEKGEDLESLESLKICEPAMGSGAFLNAVVDELAPKLAKHYHAKDLDLNQKYRADCQKRGSIFKHEDAPKVLEMNHYIQKAKSHFMNHCVYGVDLNKTAVELAKISLWLNCLHEDGNLPFLDFKLKFGNSLVGGWIDRFKIKNTSLQHFLVPSPDSLDTHFKGKVLGIKDMPFISTKEKREEIKARVNSWKKLLSDKSMRARVEIVSQQVETLYKKHIELKKQKRLELHEARSASEKQTVFSRFQEEDVYYNQLRSTLDLWCSIWFWPVEKLDCLPDAENYLLALEWMVDTPLSYGGKERLQQIDESGLDFLKTAREISLAQKFFHWDLEFAEVMSDGGFDLVLGNPPWAPVRWEDADFFELAKPGIHSQKMDSKGKQKAYLKELEENDLTSLYVDSYIRSAGLATFLKSSHTYKFEDASKTNTYRYFYQRFHELAKSGGIHTMIAQDGILTDKGCLDLRPTFYKELKKLYRFKNELILFEDITNQIVFAVWISSKGSENIDFEMIDNLYHPSTIDKCNTELDSAPYRGMKDEKGKFELRGHPFRKIKMTDKELKALSKFQDLEDEKLLKLAIIHGKVEHSVLSTLATANVKMANAEWSYFQMMNETNAPKKGLITRNPKKPNRIEQSCLTGPNVFVSNPAYKIPNPGCKNNLDFSRVDLSRVDSDYYPETVYQITDKGLKSSEYLSKTGWGSVHSEEYRIISRQMVDVTGVRTLSSAIIPPGPGHTNGLCTISFKDLQVMITTSALFHSLIYDFLVRSVCGGNLTARIYQLVPLLDESQLKSTLVHFLIARGLRLTSISTYYDDLWKSAFKKEMKEDPFTSEYMPKLPYAKLSSKWSFDTCIRDWKAREQALCEIDAIVAHLFGFDKETLLTLYRSQFGVLQKNLGDLPGQQVGKDDDEHFPRYEAMAKAYDQAAAYLKAKSKKAA